MWPLFNTADVCLEIFEPYSTFETIRSEVEHQPPESDDVCVSSAPLASPSPRQPFVFLWDEKAGGSPSRGGAPWNPREDTGR